MDQSRHELIQLASIERRVECHSDGVGDALDVEDGSSFKSIGAPFLSTSLICNLEVDLLPFIAHNTSRRTRTINLSTH